MKKKLMAEKKEYCSSEKWYVKGATLKTLSLLGCF